MRHGYREITGKSKHSLFKTQLLKWVGGTGTGSKYGAVYRDGSASHFFAAAVLERRLKQRPWRARIQRVFSVLSLIAEIVRDLNAFRPSLPPGELPEHAGVAG
jgi:hypothetical protein